jgi:hypothetical protein
MSYRDDAFFNIANIEPRAYGDNDNANFLYPDNQIRFLAAQSALDGTNNQYKIKRGYIRGLAQPGLLEEAAFTSYKCSFQFNPQTIQQTVTMSQDTYLPLLQDPYQFSQPMGKSTNFQFDLLFDRSREVAKGMGNPGPNSPYAIGQLENGVNYSADVYEIGALADLQLLYAIIGQGFSKELIDFQVQRLAQAAITAYNANSESASAGLSTSATAIDSSGSNINELARTAVSANFGNSAFIIPAPVRVMFSSLFMVDGFVTGTTVDFLKFSTNMVPLQIRVGISMEAMYIGFARKKTFLTDSLEKAGAALQQQVAEEQAQQRAAAVELTTALQKYLNSIQFGWSRSSYWVLAVSSNSSDVDPTGDESPTRLYELIFKQPKPEWFRTFQIGFKSAVSSSTTSNTTVTQNTLVDPRTGLNVKETILDSGEPTVLTVNYKFKVWGPFPSLTTVAGTETPNGYAQKEIDPPDTYLRGSYENTTSSDDPWFFAKTFREPPLTNMAVGGLDIVGRSTTELNSFRNNSYYVWSVEITFSATRTTSGGVTPLSKTVKRYGANRGDAKVYGSFAFNWTKAGRGVDNPNGV